MSTAVADQPITVDDDPMIHRVLAGKYRIEARTGAGSMGAIYRARHLTLDKVVCVKVMHDDAARVSILAQRFEREARAASRLDHPNSVRVLDHGKESDGTMYIVMEFLDGRDLFELLADGAFASERTVDIMAQTLSALAAAHDVGILHRDLKPENIMVTSAVADDGSLHERVKVCDFGIAQVVDPDVPEDGRRITSKGFIVGTPEYMSPEQARGEATDARSDVYSAGILMFQLLTGRLPFEADTAVGVALKQLGEEPPRPRDLNATVHPVLEEICLRAVRKLPAERYATAREMRTAVCSALGISAPVVAPRREDRETLTEGCGPAPETETETDTFPLPLVRAARSVRLRSRRRSAAVLFAATVVLGVSGLGFAQRHQLGPTTLAVATAAAALLDSAKLPAAVDSVRTASLLAERVDRVTPQSSGVPDSVDLSVAEPAAAPPRVVARSSRPDVKPAPMPPAPASPLPTLTPPVPAPAPAPVPVAPPARVAPASSRYNLDVAHVDIGLPVQVSGATSLALQYAIAPTRPKLDACYRDALPRTSGSLDGVATLHVETDDVGVVRRAHVAGALASDVGPCIARAVIGGRVRNVDTGAASADLPLTYRPR